MMLQRDGPGIISPGKFRCGHRDQVSTRHSDALTCLGMASPPKKGSRNSKMLTLMRVSRKLIMLTGLKSKISMHPGMQGAGQGNPARL